MDLSLVGSVVDGKYRVEGLLGRGGMGAVFRAVHLGTDRTVALKVIVPDRAAHADFLARFEREARACGRLRHPNIVDVTDFGYSETNGDRLAYLVMEYLDGCSLADVLRDAKALPTAWVVDVLGQVGSALEEAHRAGILHRDLKPDNIWLEPNRRGGYTVKVLDFGLAKLGQPIADKDDAAPQGAAAAAAQPSTAVNADDTEQATQVRPSGRTPSDEGATELGSIMGTPAYMSPEQCRGLPLTPRSDVYSLALVAYRLLAGELPFSGSSEALLVAHVSQAPRPIRELRKDLPKAAAELVMRGLSKNPEDRPPSAGAFAEMLAARAQSSGDFLKEALLLFLEHARAFLSASILGLSPVLLLGLFGALNALAYVYGIVIVPASAGAGFVVAAIMMTVGPGLLLLQGAVIPATMQAVVSPLQPIDVKTLQRRFRPRLRSYLAGVAPMLVMFVATGLWQIPVRPIIKALQPILDGEDALAILGAISISLLPNLPLLVMLAALIARSGTIRGLHFLGAVAVVEGLPMREAMARSAQLASGAGSQRVTRPLIIGLSFLGGVAGAAASAMLARRVPRPVAVGALAPLFALAFVAIGPFFAVLNALNYLRARRVLGEPLDRALADFERAVLPESHWKLAERERVATLIASRR